MLKEPKNAQFRLPGGAAIPDDENAWSRETSLRGDLLILEQIEALEDRVASASMQTKVGVTGIVLGSYRAIQRPVSHVILNSNK